MVPLSFPSGDHSVCGFTCLSRQHEGPLGPPGFASSVLRESDQSHAQIYRSSPGETQVCQRIRLPAQQVRAAIYTCFLIYCVSCYKQFSVKSLIYIMNCTIKLNNLIMLSSKCLLYLEILFSINHIFKIFQIQSESDLNC